MGKSSKRLRCADLTGVSIHRFLQRAPQPSTCTSVPRPSKAPGYDGTKIWEEIPEWVRQLGAKLSTENPLLSKGGMLELLVPYILQAEVQRDFDFVEIFSGKAECTKSLRRAGLRGVGFDEKYSSYHNINSITGLLNIAIACKRVKPQGVLVMAPQCSMWLRFLDANNHKRSQNDVFGDESVPDVFEANITATIVAWLTEYMFYRNVWTLLEQPSDSVHGNFPSVKSVYELLGIKRHLTYLGAFGNPLCKGTYLWTSFPSEVMECHLVRPKPEAGTKAKSTYISKNGSTCGAKDLENSEAYTREFGDSISQALLYARSL